MTAMSCLRIFKFSEKQGIEKKDASIIVAKYNLILVSNEPKKEIDFANVF